MDSSSEHIGKVSTPLSLEQACDAASHPRWEGQNHLVFSEYLTARVCCFGFWETSPPRSTCPVLNCCSALRSSHSLQYESSRFLTILTQYISTCIISVHKRATGFCDNKQSFLIGRPKRTQLTGSNELGSLCGPQLSPHVYVYVLQPCAFQGSDCPRRSDRTTDEFRCRNSVPFGQDRIELVRKRSPA